MNLDVGTSEVLAAAVGILGAWFTYLGAKSKARASKEATLPEGWRHLTSEMHEFFGEQLEVRDRRIDNLEEKLSTFQRKYHHSLVVIREFRDENPDSAVVIHEEIIEDL